MFFLYASQTLTTVLSVTSVLEGTVTWCCPADEAFAALCCWGGPGHSGASVGRLCWQKQKAVRVKVNWSQVQCEWADLKGKLLSCSQGPTCSVCVYLTEGQSQIDSICLPINCVSAEESPGVFLWEMTLWLTFLQWNQRPQNTQVNMM